MSFKPVAPDRVDKPLPVWRLFVGQTAANPLVGWPHSAFQQPYWYRRVFTIRYHLINDPDAIGRIFLDNAGNYAKPPLVRRILSGLVGEGLLTAEGAAWREQRRLMAPAFTPGAVADFAPLFSSCAAQASQRWATGPIDVAAEATRTTATIISRALFSDEPSLTSDEAADHMHAALAAASEYRLGVMIGAPWLDRSPVARRGAVGRRYILDRLTAFIERRRSDPNPPADFMTRLLSAFSQDRPAGAAAKLALDNAVTFYIAGHETTANAIAWTLYLLSEDQAAQARAASDPVFLRQVIEETMRLYPPAPRIDRVALADDELCGHRIRKGDTVSVWPWVVHRHQRLWREPDLFDPENFSEAAKSGRHRFQYLPFGAGPRICIGAQFAMTEAMTILADWLAAWRFLPDRSRSVFPRAEVTLRPDGGLHLWIEPRKAA